MLRILSFLAVSALCVASLPAEDITTIKGDVFKNVQIVAVERDGLLLKSEYGLLRVRFVVLPPELQRKYGYAVRSQTTADGTALPAPAAPAPAAREAQTGTPSRLPDESKAAGGKDAREQDFDRTDSWPRVWGYLEGIVVVAGKKIAANGQVYKPLFALDLNLNISLLSNKKLYLFGEGDFWSQRAQVGVTNSNQGSFDFSKREYDLSGGVAWNYIDELELRLSVYSFNNLNRGTSTVKPSGSNDGVIVENRYYFGSASPYDLGRLMFASVGYYTSKTLTGGDGYNFRPALFAEVYLTYEIPAIRSYLYCDGRLVFERLASPRLLTIDTGGAFRPFNSPKFELRLGEQIDSDVKVDITRNLSYTSFRIAF